MVDLSICEQHVESRPNSIETDRKNFASFSKFFERNDTFPDFPKVLSLDTGLIENITLHCHHMFYKDQEVLREVKNKYFSECH